jgi:ubiquinone/menaquinone biosynthesis C-methylase UbiE
MFDWLRKRARVDRDPVAASVRDCCDAHSGGTYFQEAEAGMQRQWEDVIWPLIRDADFASVLELAPGHGRNTVRLLDHAGQIDLVDVNAGCIDHCRGRFAGDARVRFHVNDGLTLSSIASDTVSFIYSWDAVVHFDREIVASYVREFARVLAPGGRGFIHHSNHGKIAPQSTWRDNPHWRSNMTRELFAHFCAGAGLEITSQRLLPWGDVEDCLSLFRKT